MIVLQRPINRVALLGTLVSLASRNETHTLSCVKLRWCAVRFNWLLREKSRLFESMMLTYTCRDNLGRYCRLLCYYFISTLLLLKLLARWCSSLPVDSGYERFDRTFPEKNIRDCRWAPIEKFQLPAYYFVLVVPMLAAYLLHAERTHCPGCADIFSLPSTSF